MPRPDEPIEAPEPAADGPSLAAADCMDLLAEVGRGEAATATAEDEAASDWWVLEDGLEDGPDGGPDGGLDDGLDRDGDRGDDGGAGDEHAAAAAAAPPLRRRGPFAGTVFTWGAVLGEVALAHAVLAAVAVQLGSDGFGWPLANPHPFLFLVLLFAAGRGLVAGLVAAVASTALHLAALHVGGDVAGWAWLDYATMREPLVWHVVAFLVGHPRDLLLRRCRDLQEREARHEQDGLRAAERHERLFAANQRLKARLLDHTAQFGNLIDTARRIEQARGPELFEIALDMVTEHCGASRCSMLAVRDGTVALAASRGWDPATTAEDLAIARGSPFVQRALARGERSDGFDPAQTPPERGPLVTAPLRDHRGRVTAVLCLDELPAERYVADVAAILAGIAEWTEVGLARAARGERPAVTRTAVKDLLRPQPWLGEHHLLPWRLRREAARASELGVPTAVLAIQAEAGTTPGPAQARRMDAFVTGALLHGLLRESDSLYRGDRPGRWVVVLPATPTTAVEGVRRRLSRRLNLARCEGVHLFGLSVPPPGALPMPADDAALPPLGDAAALARQLRIELHLAVRHGGEVYLAVLRPGVVPDGDALVRRATASLLGAADSLHRLAPGRYAVLLPGTIGASAFPRAAALTAALRAALPDTPVPPAEVYALGSSLAESTRLLDRVLARQLGHLAPAEAAR